jgi:hypothetical protein
MTIAALAAAMVHSHDSSRTLSQPGDSTSDAVSCRNTINA